MIRQDTEYTTRRPLCEYRSYSAGSRKEERKRSAGSKTLARRSQTKPAAVLITCGIFCRTAQRTCSGACEKRSQVVHIQENSGTWSLREDAQTSVPLFTTVIILERWYVCPYLACSVEFQVKVDILLNRSTRSALYNGFFNGQLVSTHT